MSQYKKNISLYDTNTAGDVEFIGNDIQISGSFWTMVYVALFGGNPDGNTQDKKLEGEINTDYWANNLLYPNNLDKQINSRLEKLLKTISLSSNNLTKIERVAKDDLKYLEYLGTIEVEASILDTDKLKLYIYITQGENVIADAEIIWENSKKENILINSEVSNVSYDYIELYVNGDVTYTLKGTGSIFIDNGDGTSSIETLSESGITIEKSYTENFIIKIYNFENVTSFQCNSSSLYDIENLIRNFTELIVLDISGTSIESAEFNEFINLEEFYISESSYVIDTNESVFSTVGGLKIFEANNSVINSLDYFTRKYNSLEEVYMQSNELDYIPYLYDTNPFESLRIIDLSNNYFETPPRLGQNSLRELSSPVEQLILRSNSLTGTGETSAEWKNLLPYLKGVSSIINLSDNEYNSDDLDTILYNIAEYNNNIDGMTIDISENAVPGDCIKFLEIIHGGKGYEIGNVLNVTSSEFGGSSSEIMVVDVDDNGGIIEASVILPGSGYYAVELTTLSGSGQDAVIMCYSSRVYLEKHGATVISDAVNDVVIPPDETIVHYEEFLKYEEDFIIW